jgi:hypothetical protein
MMKALRRMCVLAALATSGILLTACTQEGESYPVPGGNNAPNASVTNPPPAAALPYYGVVDRRDCESVGGWVMHTADPDADLKVELNIDGKLIETIPARTLRPDLANKVGTGRYGFSFKIPSAYKDARPHLADVKVAGSEYAVPFFEGVFSTFECQP